MGFLGSALNKAANIGSFGLIGEGGSFSGTPAQGGTVTPSESFSFNAGTLSPSFSFGGGRI